MQVSVLWNESILFSPRAELLMFTNFECVFECNDLRKGAERRRRSACGAVMGRRHR